MKHPQHDAVATALRDAYHRSHQEMGWLVEERPFGIYRRNVRAATHPSVIVRGVSPGDVPAFLLNARNYFGAGPLPANIAIAERDLDLAT
jgi:hypothetical protein